MVSWHRNLRGHHACLLLQFFLTIPTVTSIILIKYIVDTVVCASVFVVFTHFTSASSTKVFPWVFELLVALFPVTYLLEGQVRIKSLLAESGVGVVGEDESKFTTLLAVEWTSLFGLFAAIFMLIALGIKFELASLMRGKVI